MGAYIWDSYSSSHYQTVLGYHSSHEEGSTPEVLRSPICIIAHIRFPNLQKLHLGTIAIPKDTAK